MTLENKITDNLVLDFINRKKESFEKTSKEMDSLLKRMKRLIVFQAVFNIIKYYYNTNIINLDDL